MELGKSKKDRNMTVAEKIQDQFTQALGSFDSEEQSHEVDTEAIDGIEYPVADDISTAHRASAKVASGDALTTEEAASYSAPNCRRGSHEICANDAPVKCRCACHS